MLLENIEADADSFAYVKGAELLSMYVGAAEHNIINLFARCRNYTRKTGKRAIIFIDEAEAILPIRGSMRSSDVDRTIVPTFLAEMDGFDEIAPFVMLSTNMPQQIDPAVLRPGRIDLKVDISRPTKEDSVDIFKIHLKKVMLSDTIVSLAELGTETLFASKACNTISGAMIETVVKMATQKAMIRFIHDKKTKKGIVAQDIIDSIDLLNLN